MSGPNHDEVSAATVLQLRVGYSFLYNSDLQASHNSNFYLGARVWDCSFYCWAVDGHASICQVM